MNLSDLPGTPGEYFASVSGKRPDLFLTSDNADTVLFQTKGHNGEWSCRRRGMYLEIPIRIIATRWRRRKARKAMVFMVGWCN